MNYPLLAFSARPDLVPDGAPRSLPTGLCDPGGATVVPRMIQPLREVPMCIDAAIRSTASAL